MHSKEKNILVVGGAGFVGSNLVDRLVKQGHSVIIIDDFSTGKKENVNQYVKLYDIPVESEDLKKVFRRESIDTVFYAASTINNKDIEEDQQLSMSNYISGFLNLMKNVVEFEVKKFILFSTLQVYGDAGSGITEDSFINPQTYHGILHATLENILKVSSKNNSFDYTILRCSNIYGKRQTETGEGGLLQRYMNMLERGSVPVILGSEHELRDYIYISDVINAALKVIELDSIGIYNIASAESKSIGKIVETLIKKMNVNVRYMVEDAKVKEIAYSNISIDKAVKELQWRPICSIELGLDITCKEKI